MDILSLRLFLSVAEHCSVSAAAQDLFMSPATASARLAKLESTIGFTLFHRTTRAISLTTDGAEFLPFAQQTIETLETGIHTVSGRKTQAKGVLRMAMSGSFGRMHVIPLLAEFQQNFPLIKLDLRLSDQIFNMVEEAYDLVIRNAPLNDSSFIARELAPDQRILVASPSYLKQHGKPRKPEDLKSHKFVTFGGSQQLKFQNGQNIEVANSSSVNDGEAMRLMIESGMGIAVKAIWNVKESLKNGSLVEVLPKFPLITEASIWALYPSGRMVPQKVRAMIDFLLEKLGPVPPWLE